MRKRKQALIVAIDNYTNYIPSGLIGCVDFDGANMKAYLEMAGYEVLFLTDEEATYARVVQAYKYLAEKSSEDTDTLIYHSGHGASNGKQQALCMHDRLLYDWKFLELVDDIFGNRLAVLDACNSEGMFYKGVPDDGQLMTKAIPSHIAMQLEWEDVEPKYVTRHGFSILAAADKEGFSYATATGSLMTNIILDALAQKKNRLWNILRHIKENLPNIQHAHYKSITKNYNLLKFWFVKPSSRHRRSRKRR